MDIKAFEKIMSTGTAKSDLEEKKLDLYLRVRGWHSIKDYESKSEVWVWKDDPKKYSPTEAKKKQINDDAVGFAYLLENMHEMEPKGAEVLVGLALVTNISAAIQKIADNHGKEVVNALVKELISSVAGQLQNVDNDVERLRLLIKEWLAK